MRWFINFDATAFSKPTCVPRDWQAIDEMKESDREKGRKRERNKIKRCIILDAIKQVMNFYTKIRSKHLAMARCGSLEKQTYMHTPTALLLEKKSTRNLNKLFNNSFCVFVTEYELNFSYACHHTNTLHEFFV